MGKRIGLRQSFVEKYKKHGYGFEFANIKADGAMDGHRANRISAAERRVVEAVHALIYSENDAAYSRNLQALRTAYASFERAKGGANG